ncbi:MAG: F0F1 ATP synthase subunit B [Thermodesulfobacteriota bacterium]
MKNYRALIFTIVLGLMMLASVSLGAEAGEGEGLKEAIWQAVNLLILIAIFYKFGKRPIKEFLENRRRSIRNSIEDAQKAKQEAEALFKEYQGKLERLGQQAEEIYEKISSEGQAEKERIVSQATKSAAKLMVEARKIGDQELAKAKTLLRREAAELAVKLAQAKIEKNLQETDQRRLVEEFLEKVREIR